MSQSSLPKLPDFLRQPIVERAVDVLRQPAALAAIASLGVHGLLAVALPLLPSEQPKEDAQRTVGVVQLTPAEQQRLPESSTPFGALPNSPRSSLPSQSSLPPLKPLPPLAPLPAPDTSLYNIPIPPPLNLPLPPPILNIPLPDFSALPQPRKPSPQPSPKPSNSPSQAAPTATPSPGGSPSAPPSPGSSSPGAATRPPLTPEQIAAIRQDWGRVQQERAQVERDRARFAFNPANTTQDAFNSNIGVFGQAAQAASKGNLEADWEIIKPPITDQYPKEACPYITDGRRTSVAIIVSPDGKPSAEPTILQSSGYKALDDIALRYVGGQTFKSSSQEKYRGVVFNFIFDPKIACPDSNPKPPA